MPVDLAYYRHQPVFSSGNIEAYFYRIDCLLTENEQTDPNRWSTTQSGRGGIRQPHHCRPPLGELVFAIIQVGAPNYHSQFRVHDMTSKGTTLLDYSASSKNTFGHFEKETTIRAQLKMYEKIISVRFLRSKLETD